MRQLCFCAPEAIRSRFARLSVFQLVNRAAALRPRGSDDVEAITLATLRTLARRVRHLEMGVDATAHDARLYDGHVFIPSVVSTLKGWHALAGTADLI
jgi:hypothetical protein